MDEPQDEEKHVGTCPVDYLTPDWQGARRVHDWKNHVNDKVRRMWMTFTPAQRAAIAESAESTASNEQWD